MLIGDLPSRQGAAGLPSGYVRFGSLADICSAKRHVRFASESGHEEVVSASVPAPRLALLEKGVEKRLGWLAMTGEEN